MELVVSMIFGCKRARHVANKKSETILETIINRRTMCLTEDEFHVDQQSILLRGLSLQLNAFLFHAANIIFREYNYNLIPSTV